MPGRSPVTFPRSELMQRFDGSQWRIYDVQGGKLVLTDSGRKLFDHNPALRASIRGYRYDLLNPSEEPNVRKYFTHGSNSDVFEVGGTGLVVKEASTSHSVWFALERLDYLYAICQRSLSPYIRVPEHYGALFSSDLSRQYLLMQKANEGLTVRDYILSGINFDETEIVYEEFDKAKRMLDRAIEEHAKRDGFPDKLLVDWHVGNVIIDFTSPAGGKPFTFCVIDQ